MATVKMAGALPLSHGGARGGALVMGGNALSPESAVASEIFNQLVAATTFKTVLHLYRQICELLRLRPTNLPAFYPRLKNKLKSWKATNLWTKLDKRASHKCYNRGRACPNSRVLIIGAGPCGLRAAIECQLLGAKVVVLEKRDRFSRNNVLHLWPFVIHDLRNLGAKKFFGKFCAGSIDHISIRQLQLILLKVALLLGVEVHENVTFDQLLEPPLDQTQERVGWRAKVSPADHPVSQYEFDVLIGADGKRNTLLGFNRKEFRGKLAIAVTANFINRQTMEEASVSEISGVAFIFNQKFFQDMREQTGVDLENIVYYKDDTHYFVMTAKKQSLLDQGVIIIDYSDTARLLSPDNVDRQMLMRYAREAADFATNGQMPHLDFAVNHYGQADVAMFDFTSMYAAENACRMVERRGHRLLQSLVGDCLLEPFWPTGSGCARGFLSALDAAWMVRSWSSGKMTPLQVLAEREACYRLLAQTTPENLHKDLNLYTLNPTSRYPNLNLLAVLPSQVRCLCDTDAELQDHLPDVVPEMLRKKRRRMSLIHPDALLAWCQRQVALIEGVTIENLSESWKSGLCLCAILHRYRPDLVDIRMLNPQDVAKNNQLAFDICEKEYNIPPIMTGQEMAECQVPDKLAMVAYLTQIYDTFRGEIPYLVRPIKSVPEEPTSETSRQPGFLSKISNKVHGKRNRYSLEKETQREGDIPKRNKTPSSLVHRRRSRDKDKGVAQSKDSKNVSLTGYHKVEQQQQPQPVSVGGKDQFRIRMRQLQKQLRRDEGLRSEESNEDEEKDKPLVGRTDWKSKRPERKAKQVKASEWNLQRLEEKMRQQQEQQTGRKEEPPAKHVKASPHTFQVQEEDQKVSREAGPKSRNRVARMAQHMAHILDWDVGTKPDLQAQEVSFPAKAPDNEAICSSSSRQKAQGAQSASGSGSSSSERCCFCQKRVYLMERLSVEGLFFHRSCFRCEYCGANLRLGHYAFDKTSCSSSSVRVFCPQHLNLKKVSVSTPKDQRFAEMMKRKHAFLSGSPLEEVHSPSSLLELERAMSPAKAAAMQPDVTLDGAAAPMAPAVATLIVPVGLDTRDRTPERVEFENSLMELSEDELLTSELEEEELTQKNLGSHQDLMTSDDEYSDLSTDPESDEDYLIEELEKSFTADGTRKLAETWQQKHENMCKASGQKLVSLHADQEALDPEVERTHSLTDEEDNKRDTDNSSEESDTETGGGDDTSDDIHTDEEYASDNHNARRPDDAVDCDIVMKVPVLSPKTIPEGSDGEYTLSEDESDELLELESAEEGHQEEQTPEEQTCSSSEEEKEEAIPPSHQIPVIVINESPPQMETDKDWSEQVERKDTDPQEGVCMQAVLEKISPDTSSDATSPSPDPCSQFVVGKPESESAAPQPVLDVSVATEPLAAQTCPEEVRRVAWDLVNQIVSEAVASVSSDTEFESKEPDSPHDHPRNEQSSCSVPIDNGSLEVIQAEQVEGHQENVSAHELINNTVSEVLSPFDTKVEDVCKTSPPLVPILGVSATRLSMDKFRFIAGAPSSQQEQFSPSKTSISPKELSSKLNEFHRKIEELQKKLPSPPVSSPPVLAPQQDAWKMRGIVSPVLNCEKYYQSLQEEIRLPTVNDTPDVNRKLDFSSLEEKTFSEESLPLDDAVSVVVPNAPVPKKDSAPVSPSGSQQGICADSGSHSDNRSEIVEETERRPEPESCPAERVNLEESNLDTADFQKDLKMETTLKTQDLSEELVELSKKYSFNPAFITLRKHNKLPASSFVKCDEETTSVENLVDVGKYKRPLPKVIGQLTSGLTSSQPELSPAAAKMQAGLSQSSASPPPPPPSQGGRTMDLPSSNNGDHRFQGYGGSFADKVRPRSLIGDSIYLKSLSINLQKLAFPSLTKESSLGGSWGALKDSECKTDPIKKSPTSSKSIENILMGGPEGMPTKFSQSAKGSQNKSFKKGTSECVPFVDEEKQSVASESIIGSVENVYGSTHSTKTMQPLCTSTPMVSRGDLESGTDDEVVLRTQRTAEQEKARQEARERARMKSDEELGLSPCNYRKRYIQASSLSLGNYDELSSDDFLDDKDDMYEDDSDNEMDGVFHEKRVAFNERVLLSAEAKPPDRPDFNLTSPLSGGESGNATSSEKTLTTSSCSRTDSANYMESSLSPEELFFSLEETGPVLLTPPSRLELSSTESSPGTPEGPPVGDKQRKVEKEGKSKSGGRKSILSLLHFGRNSNSGNAKEKSSKNKSRSSSLPPDIRGQNKERTFALLKFTRGRDRSRDKQKKKKSRDSAPEEEEQEEKQPTHQPKSASEPPEASRFPSILKAGSSKNAGSGSVVGPFHAFLPAFKVVVQTENGLAPKASVDSLTDTEEEGSKAHSQPMDAKVLDAPLPSGMVQLNPHPSSAEKEQRLMRMAQRVHRKQELKRFRTGHDIERRLQEIDVLRKDLEKRGVTCEKALRGEPSVSPSSSKRDLDLMQEWFSLIRSRNKLEREEQELIIRMKDLELEERHSILQQEMRERMAKSDDLKSKADVEKERDILTDMLSIVEKRDELVLTLDQLRLREEVEDRDLENQMLASGLSPQGLNR